MPLYNYLCPGCRKAVGAFRKIEARNSCPECECGQKMERVLEAPRVVADLPGYDCPITGTWIEGRRAHEENLARHGCRVLESGEREAAARRRARADAELESSLAATVESHIHSLPARRREKLESELIGGFDASIVRATPTLET